MPLMPVPKFYDLLFCNGCLLVLTFPGLVRLVGFMCRSSAFGCREPLKVIVDCGTGTTAVGLALGVALFRCTFGLENLPHSRVDQVVWCGLCCL